MNIVNAFSDDVIVIDSFSKATNFSNREIIHFVEFAQNFRDIDTLILNYL